MFSTIAIVTCYYGPLPWYFPYFLHSCKYNPSVDFFIITDNNESVYDIPSNVKFIVMSLSEIETLATERLGFPISIPYAYKLCDFKPAYGYIFSDFLQKYKFWGHGDIDVVYGNIRTFITEALLDEYDVISVRHDYITGTCALFRNTEKINALFKVSKDIQKVFSEERHFCFDECNFLWAELEAGMAIEELECEIESMTHVVKNMCEKGEIKAHFDFIIIEGAPGKIKWENGRIFYKNQFEAMLYHLIRFKTICDKKPTFKCIPSTFYFSEKKLYK